jgi:hypothetical protein
VSRTGTAATFVRRRRRSANFEPRRRVPDLLPSVAAGDRGIAVCPVVAAAGEQAHGSAVATHDQPIAVVLDLVHPVGPGRRLGGKGRDAGIDEAVGTDAAGDHGIEIFPHHRPVESSQ